MQSRYCTICTAY